MRGVTLGVVLTLVLVGRPALAGVEADVEAGVVFASRNDAWLHYVVAGLGMSF